MATGEDNLTSKISNINVEDIVNRTMPQGPPLRMLLLGKTGSGKSLTGNLILSDSKDEDIPEIFESTGESVSVTAKVKKHTRTIRGRMLTVVDTPGVCDTSKDDDVTLHEIASAVVKSPDGYDVFIIVLRYPTRMTGEERKAIKQLTDLFGDEIFKYTIVLFTHGQTFHIEQRRAKKKGQDREMTIQEFVNQDELSSDPGAMGPILSPFKGGIVLVENFEESYLKREAMVHELIQKADAVREKNQGQPYTNFMFDHARCRIAQEMSNPDSVDISSKKKNKLKDEVKEKVAEDVAKEAKKRTFCTIL